VAYRQNKWTWHH